VTGREALTKLGRLADRLTDNWIFDIITGSWVDRPIDNYLDRSNTEKSAPRRQYLDADGNKMAAPSTAGEPTPRS
jgi:hypothetical protein